eukprot:scaffold1058_cov362-Prasinococcus_capsulatus_cf.AAC.5
MGLGAALRWGTPCASRGAERAARRRVRRVHASERVRARSAGAAGGGPGPTCAACLRVCRRARGPSAYHLAEHLLRATPRHAASRRAAKLRGASRAASSTRGRRAPSPPSSSLRAPESSAAAPLPHYHGRPGRGCGASERQDEDARWPRGTHQAASLSPRPSPVDAWKAGALGLVGGLRACTAGSTRSGGTCACAHVPADHTVRQTMRSGHTCRSWRYCRCAQKSYARRRVRAAVMMAMRAPSRRGPEEAWPGDRGQS